MGARTLVDTDDDPEEVTMDCPHLAVSLTEELVRLSHCVSVVHWFTCDACGERATVVTRTEMFLERG